MVDAASRPFISVESVKAALDLLLYTTSSPQANPLEHLLLVDHFLANPDFPRTTLDRDIAIKHILVECITNEFFRQRQITLRELPDALENSQAVNSYIQEDGASQNPELIGWSVLFYRYVRVELNLTLEKYSQLAYLEPRTTRRYQLHSISRLTEKLIGLEWETRAFYRHMRLQTILPSITSTKLFGRDALFTTADELFQEKRPQHFQITGIAGIGKTAFVQEFVRQQIEKGMVDEIIWLNRPRSVQHARYQVLENLSGDHIQFDLRQYTLLNRLYVVIDDSDHLQPAELKDLLLDLSGACVFLISRQQIVLDALTQHLHLTELSDHDTIALIKSLADTAHDITDSYAAYIWQTLGGNPLVIRLAINNLSLRHPDFLDRTALEHVFDQTFDSLPDTLKAAWVICALYPPGDIDVSHLLHLWGDFVGHESIDALLKRKLLEQGYEPTTLRMVLSAQNYLKNSSQHNQKIEVIIHGALDYLSHPLPSKTSITYQLMEHILLAGWPVLDEDRYDSWVRALAGIGIGQGRYLTWVSILENYPHTLLDTGLCFHYAKALRHLSAWDNAYELLEKVIAGYGQKGQFREQGRALLEIGILLRQKGTYAEALRVFDKAEKIALRLNDHTLEHDLKLEFAQIAVDQRNITLFQAVTEHLPVTTRLMSMQIAVCLSLGDLEKALELARAILEFPETTAVSAGRIYGTMGRIYEQKGDYERAAQHLSQAITILEQERDRYALARAQSNLGAILTHLKVYDEAGELLGNAQHVQHTLGDRTGLAATHHNLTILRQQMTAH